MHGSDRNNDDDEPQGNPSVLITGSTPPVPNIYITCYVLLPTISLDRHDTH